MAKVTVVRAAPVEPPVEKVVLELSHEEARALVNVLGALTSECDRACGGGNTLPLYTALADAGYESATRAILGPI